MARFENLSRGWYLISIAILFFIVANPATYRLTNQLFDAIGAENWILDADEHVLLTGLLTHTLVFVLILWALLTWF